MKFADFKFLVMSDLYRITGDASLAALLQLLFWGEGYQYIFWMRACAYSEAQPWLRYSFYPIARLILHNLTYKLGISIPYNTKIGSGFYIGHFGGIVVNERSIIGKNCNISHGVTLGQANRGKNKGCPILGDNVYIGPGAKIVGAVKIGNNVAIGANCVVTSDIPDNAVVVGNPGHVISYKGTIDYVNRTDYEPVMI